MDPMIFCITLGGAIALLLSVLTAVAPVATRNLLPLGGSDFSQTAIVFLSAIAIATVINLWGIRGESGMVNEGSSSEEKAE